MTRHIILCPVLAGLAFASTGRLAAQTTINPDISLIPRFVLETNDGEELPGRRIFSRPDFSFQELEFVASAYLNPFSKADVVMTVPGPDVETAKLGLEELSATVFRGLPLDLNLRFGKYRAEFGKLGAPLDSAGRKFYFQAAVDGLSDQVDVALLGGQVAGRGDGVRNAEQLHQAIRQRRIEIDLNKDRDGDQEHVEGLS